MIAGQVKLPGEQKRGDGDSQGHAHIPHSRGEAGSRAEHLSWQSRHDLCINGTLVENASDPEDYEGDVNRVYLILANGTSHDHQRCGYNYHPQGRAIAVMISVKEPASEGRAENQYGRHDEKYSADSCRRIAHDSLQVEGSQDEDGKVRNDEQYYADDRKNELPLTEDRLELVH